MKTLIQNPILGLLFLAMLSSCGDDPAPDLPPTDYSKGVFILNEGVEGANDGEVFHYDPDLGVLTPDLFEKVNGRRFDGILVDMLMADDRIYLVSSAGKVEIVNANDFSSRATVTEGLERPSSVAVEGGKLFVADFGPENTGATISNAYVAVFDGLDGGSTARKIPVMAFPEIFIATDYNLLVASQKGGEVQFVGVASETKEFHVNLNPAYEMVGIFVAGLGANFYMFNNDGIYLLTTLYPSFVVDIGRSYELANATKNFAVLNSYEFALITSSGKAGEKDEVQIINYNGRSPLFSTKFIDGTNLNGIGFDVSKDEFYLADAKDGTGNGEVRIYKRDGTLVKTLSVGKNPAGFYAQERMR